MGFGLPQDITVHLDAGYDSGKTRDLLSEFGCTGVVSIKGTHSRQNQRSSWVVERTNSWHNRGFKKLLICTERTSRVIEAFIALANAVTITRRLLALLRWCQIQADHIDHLGFQSGIGGELERVGSPRPHPVLGPDIAHRGMVDAQPGGQEPRGPVRHSQTGRWRRQRRRDHAGAVQTAGPSRPLLIVQPRHACWSGARRRASALGCEVAASSPGTPGGL